LEEKDPERRERGIQEALRRAFRPEFLNRIDEVVTFAHLEREQVGVILKHLVDQLNARIRERGLTVELTPEAQAWLVERGFDRDFGARPLKRLFQREVQDRLAVLLLEGGFKPGLPVRVGVDSGSIRLLS
jgi:ATP-dependent Clp protease ATP-binding subunit ClpB